MSTRARIGGTRRNIFRRRGTRPGSGVSSRVGFAFDIGHTRQALIDRTGPRTWAYFGGSVGRWCSSRPGAAR